MKTIYNSITVPSAGGSGLSPVRINWRAGGCRLHVKLTTGSTAPEANRALTIVMASSPFAINTTDLPDAFSDSTHFQSLSCIVPAAPGRTVHAASAGMRLEGPYVYAWINADELGETVTLAAMLTRESANAAWHSVNDAGSQMKVTVSDVATDFASLGVTLHADTTRILASLESGNVRIRMDGTPAASDEGLLFYQGDLFELDAAEFASASVIRAGDSDAVFNLVERI